MKTKKNNRAEPILIEKVWGGRSFVKLFGKKLPKGKLIGECWVFYEKNHPIVIKLLDVRKPLSVQVHPYGKNGKSELWYILEAGKKTRVLGGITLDEYNVKKGDWVYLPGGTVHTILPPAVLLEVSQSNLITYRLYDWGRDNRPLDIEDAIKNLKIDFKPKIYRNIDSFKCPYFNIKRLKLNKGKIIQARGICFVLNGFVETKGNIISKGEALSVNQRIHSLSKAEIFLVNPVRKK